MNKKERFRKAFEFLVGQGLAHRQRDISAKMKATPSNVSRAFRGEESALTDNFLRRFNAAYGKIFNEEWLIFGDGEMLAAKLVPPVIQNIHMEAGAMIQSLLDYSNLNAAQLAQQLGVNSQTIYDLLSGKTGKLSTRLKAKIKSEYPEINPVWLSRGTGDMVAKSAGVIQQGDHSFNGKNIVSHGMESELLSLLSSKETSLAKAQEHISELIDVIQNLTKSQEK